MLKNNNNQTKICCRCKKRKPYSAFFKDKHNKKYGLSGYCKKCKVEYQKELRNKKKLKKQNNGKPKNEKQNGKKKH